jgi:hypothetical protein
MNSGVRNGLIGASVLAAVLAIAVFVTLKADLIWIPGGNRPFRDYYCNTVATHQSYAVIFMDANNTAASVNFNSSATPNPDTPGFHHNVFVAKQWFDLINAPCVSAGNISTFKLHRYLSSGEDDWAWTPAEGSSYSIQVTHSDSGILKNEAGKATTP